LGLPWLAQWHYAVAIGYDLPGGEITLHSGTTRDMRVAEHVFLNTWARSRYWGLAVLPPTRLPASADARGFVAAAAGLERGGRHAAAITAYETALAKWPDSFGARMGLGNARYAAGDLAGAEAAFREAVRRHPEAAPAFNNLAQVLADQGRYDEAHAAISRALELGGELTPVYRQTLAEILAARS
ncbi:MAG: PA2778 family cysteine peptidase, partial [Gammaproteobacteria bacterium]|nr:PA2778 family cysteine peptidase [Gammaproteobacteria bacterium]